MVKTILIDDEQRLLGNLKKMLELHCPDLQIAALCRDADDGLEKIKSINPELVFLDISMPGKSAFDLLNELDSIDFEVIFVTAHNSYMEMAFKYSAIDYLLKPVDEEELIKATGRAMKRIREHHTHHQLQILFHNLQKQYEPHARKLCVATINGFEVIDLEEIVYCEADGAYANFYLNTGKKMCASRPLLDYELLLQDSSFMRIHKSFLVNMRHIKQYKKGEGGTVILSNGAEIEVSRRKKEQFLFTIRELYKH